MGNGKKRFKSKKELKPLIKQAEGSAKVKNAFSKAAKQGALEGFKEGIVSGFGMAGISPQGSTISNFKKAFGEGRDGTRTNVGNPSGTGPKPMSHTLSRGQQRSFELREAHEDPGIEDKYTLDMPIVDRETQTTDEEDYDRGDYEKSYGPGRKYGHPEKPSPARKGVRDADTEDMPINTDEKEGAYVYSPANKRMGDMVSAAQQAYSDKHASTPPVKPVKAEEKKSNLIFVKSDYTIDPRTRERVFSEHMETGDDDKTSVNVSRSPENFGLFTVKKEDGSEVPVNPSHDSVVPRSVVKDVPIGSEHQKAVSEYNESRQNPLSPAKGVKIKPKGEKDTRPKGTIEVKDMGTYTHSDSAMEPSTFNPAPQGTSYNYLTDQSQAPKEMWGSPGKLRGGPSKAKAIAEQKKKEAAARAARGKKPKK